MQSQDTQKQNVVSLFANRDKNTAKAEEAAPAEGQDESFEAVMNRNAKNKERLEKERASANKSVLRSYRIKH